MIPKFKETAETKNLSLGALKKYAKAFFNEHLAGKYITNKEQGIKIKLRKESVRHVLFARDAGYIKTKALFIADKMIAEAELIDTGLPDAKDTGIVAFLNFKVEVIIEEETHLFRVVVSVTKDGHFYYDHAVRVNKKKS